VNNKISGKWNLDDGNQSNIAKDSSTYSRNGTLTNFDTSSSWVINPKLSKLHTFNETLERQSIPKFTMNIPSKITYDWGRQHAAIINTLPENLGQLSSITVLSNENQSGYTGAVKYWYNHGTQLVFSSQHHFWITSRIRFDWV
jgi:hypothetical protein